MTAQFDQLTRTLLTELEAAVEAVKADVRATGMAGQLRLDFADERDSYLRDNFAHFRGSLSYKGGISSNHADNQINALLAVADDVQDTIMGSQMAAWPVCPEHELGGHPREHDGQAVWWCNGGGSGHVITLIGHWTG